MPLRTDTRLRAVVMTVLIIGALSAEAEPGQQTSLPPNAERPNQGELDRAIEKVKADPNLATERTIQTLRWKQSSSDESKPFRWPGWLAWIAGLFRWLDESARFLVWGVAAVLVVGLAFYILRLVRRYGQPPGENAFVIPTHVRDLDIRPETLPENIGQAARALWDRGERRASLALLYRGLLSRLVHVHRVPIRDSSTEGDCLVLAATHLAQGKHEFAARLVRVWQRFVYGREEVQTGTVHTLCDDFAAALDRAASPDSLTEGPAFAASRSTAGTA